MAKDKIQKISNSIRQRNRHNKVRTFVVKLPDDYKPKVPPSKQHRKSKSKDEKIDKVE